MRYRQQVVRDLAWVILSPPLVRLDGQALGSVSEEWCLGQYKLLEPQLLALDRDPSPLLRAMGPVVPERLGKYFEALIAFWIQASPSLALLGRNIQIRDAKQTYGELDLLVRDLECNRTSHWEVAVKFYLQDGTSSLMSSWVGPNKRDNLGRKMGHLVLHQALRHQHPVALGILEQMGIAVDDSRLFVKGWLFHAIGQSGAAPNCTAPLVLGEHEVALHTTHLRAWWRTKSQFEQLAARRELEWRELQKPNWLVEQTNLVQLEEQHNWTPLQPSEQAQISYVVGMSEDLECERGFVVPDDWMRTDSQGDAVPVSVSS